MCRLVTEAEDVAPFIPMLLPALRRAADETADLEAAGEAKSAVDALVKALGVGHVADRAKAGLSGPSRLIAYRCLVSHSRAKLNASPDTCLFSHHVAVTPWRVPSSFHGEVLRVPESKSFMEKCLRSLLTVFWHDAAFFFAGPSDEETERVTADMRKEIERAMGAARSAPPADAVVNYLASLCASLVLHGFGDAGPAVNENWEQVCVGEVGDMQGSRHAFENTRCCRYDRRVDTFVT